MAAGIADRPLAPGILRRIEGRDGWQSSARAKARHRGGKPSQSAKCTHGSGARGAPLIRDDRLPCESKLRAQIVHFRTNRSDDEQHSTAALD